MGRGLGIAALVIAIISIFIPAAGIFIGWLALILVTIAALVGEVGLTVAVVAASFINYVFMSPRQSAGVAAQPWGTRNYQRPSLARREASYRSACHPRSAICFRARAIPAWILSAFMPGGSMGLVKSTVSGC
jgi:hypothetical protein